MLDVAAFQPPTQEDVQIDLRAVFLGAIRLSLELLLEEEIRELVGAGKWKQARTRRDFRNGTYLRRVVTSLGLTEVSIPRSRENGSAGEVLGRYRRRTQEVDDAITEAYVQGVSTRKMSKVTAALMDETIGRSSVSRVTKRLEDQVEALRKAPIQGPMPYLFLDATFIDTRWARKVENVAALVAYGVDHLGHRRLLAITIGVRESEDSWTELLKQLIDRGLAGVKLVVADGHEGLKAAVRHLLPEVRLQRCVVHLERNVLTKTPHRLRRRLARAVSFVFAAASLPEARRRLEELKAGLGKHVPEAIECLEAGFPAGTQFFAFPKAHWRRIRSTNGLERLHGEIKRRIRAVGAFPDRASALRLITAVALQATAIWSDRRYLDMSLLAPYASPTARVAKQAA